MQKNMHDSRQHRGDSSQDNSIYTLVGEVCEKARAKVYCNLFNSQLLDKILVLILGNATRPDNGTPILP